MESVLSWAQGVSDGREPTESSGATFACCMGSEAASVAKSLMQLSKIGNR
jgi:hypothetical protein